MDNRQPVSESLIRRLIRSLLPTALFKERWSEEPYANNQVPKYNSATGKFEPGTVGTGGIGGSVTTVMEAGAQVGDADIVTLDFGAGFDISEGPDTEINIALDFSEAAPTHAQLGSVTADQHHAQAHDHSVTGDGTALVPASINDTGALSLSGDITVSISAAQNNWNPTGLSTASTIYLSATAALKSISGIVAPATNGRILIIHNTGAYSIPFKHDNGVTSDPENRFWLPAGQDIYLPASDWSLVLQYDELEAGLGGTAGRWKVVGAGPMVVAGSGHTQSGMTITGATADDSTVGHVELATDAETLTGTDAFKAITPANLKNSHTDQTDPHTGYVLESAHSSPSYDAGHHAQAHDHTTGDSSGVLTNDEHDGYSEYTEIATPSNPAANKLRVYPKDVAGVTKLHTLDSSGTETELGAGGGGTHDIFSATHTDTTGAASPADGDIIIGNVTPKWSKLAVSIPAANVRNVLGVDNGELRPSWKAILDGTAPAAVGTAAAGTALTAAHRDHVHAAVMTAITGGNWKVFYTNGSGVVVELALGAANTVLTSNGASSAPSFAAAPGGADLDAQNLALMAMVMG